MKTHVLRAALLLGGACALVPLAGQTPDEAAVPKVLTIAREQIKEGRESAHEKSEQAWVRAFEKGNISSHYLGMTAETGPSEAWFLIPYDSFAAVEKARAEVGKSSVSGDLEAAAAADGELRTGSRNLLAVFRGELSYRAADAMAGLPKCRYMEVTLLRIKYGHEADLAQAAKMLISGDQLSNSDQAVLTYQVISGAPSGTYFLFEPMDSLARMDEGPARSAAARQAMGERNRQHFESLVADAVQSTESLLFSMAPRMSYVSKEFAAQDPAFWNPAPPPPAKPAAKPRHRPAP